MDEINKIHIFNDSLGFYANEFINRMSIINPSIKYCSIIYPTYPHEKVQYFDPNTSKDFIHQYFRYATHLYIHFYTFPVLYYINIAKKVNPNIIITWMFWSGEYYNNFYDENDIYLNHSKKYIRLSLGRSLGRYIKNMIGIGHEAKKRSLMQAFLQADFFACILPFDFENVYQNKRHHCKFIPFSYLAYDQIIPTANIADITHGKEIMINHSADPSLNHYEAMMAINNLDIKNKIILSLAYGKLKYKHDIITLGKEMFADRLVLITEYYPKEHYFLLIKHVGFAIFNNKIQQGFGTIVPLLWMGVKLFMREENSIYKTFKSWGIIIFSIQKDLQKDAFADLLRTDQVLHNRTILSQYLSSKAVDTYYRNL